jgi:iron(III) transport system ATP-binding protein
MTPAPLLEVDHVACAITGLPVVHDASFRLQAGELGCLLGPSGCGKTTLLRAIGGFQPLAAGVIRLRGKEVSSPARQIPPERRRIGFVFQDLALFPHLTVAENIAFGLDRVDRRLRTERVDEMLALLGLDDYRGRYPHELSGGQQQRVALARSLAPRPDLLLLDEPFSSLDAHLRHSLREEMQTLLRRLGIAALLVTHDQNEAFSFADRIGVMQDGRMVQWDAAFDVYHRPATPFVARFVGEGRLIRGQVVDDDTVDTALGTLHGPLPPGPAPREVSVLVRPDDLRPIGDDCECDEDEPDDHGDADSHGVEVTVRAVAFRGAETLYTLRLQDGSEVCALFPSHHRHAPGDQIRIRTDLEHLVVFAR